MGKYELTVFPDGRSIISGTNDVSVAKGLYAKYIGCNRKYDLPR